ncbi:hypothetical protein ACEPAI_8999 [Sanghuangporus weigelae]
MSRRVPGSSQDTFRDNPTEPPPPSRRPRVTELPEELHNKIILPPREWEQLPGDPRPSRPSHPSSQNTSTQQQQLPSISARLPGLRGGSDRNRGPLPSLREATAFVPEIRSLNLSRGARQSGSPSYTSGRALGRDEPASRQDLPYTSLPRYSADISNGADEARYARELPLPEYEGRYEANSATAAPLPQRSFTFPATSEERTYSHHSRAPATDTFLVPPRARPHEPISGTPPPFRRHLAATPPAFRGPPQTYGGPPMAYPASASMAGQGEDMIVSPRSTPVHSSIRERKESGDFGSLHPEYVPAHEGPYFPRHMHQLSQPFPMSSDPPPKAKRSHSASVERVGRTSASALVVMDANPSGSGVSASERGGASRSRGRNPGKRTATSPITESSSEEPQIPTEPPVLWGRQQRTAKTAPMRGQSSSSPTMIAPAPRLTAETPIHPDLLSMSGVMHAEEPFARASSEQSTAAHSIARKDKGKSKEAGPGDTQEGSADKEEDELQETSDEDGKLQFNFASSGPSRTGSAGGTRAPRTKIEVACNFCRQRKMKCDGLRPTCRNCARKGNECKYIEEVRRRGPGKKKKAIDARPKKLNKRIEAERQAKRKGKDKATGSTDVSTQETETGSWQSEASGSGLQAEGAATQQFTSAIGQGGPSGGLYLPSPLQQMQSSPVIEGSTPALPGGPNISPFPSGSLSLPLYSPEQFPPPYGQSPPFAGGNVFLPGQSPGMHTRDIVDSYAGVGVNISESGGSSIMMSEVSLPDTSRTASMSSSGSSSSDGELERQSRRRRTSKRARTVTRRARELEEGEIDEGGPPDSGGPQR